MNERCLALFPSGLLPLLVLSPLLFFFTNNKIIFFVVSAWFSPAYQ